MVIKSTNARIRLKYFVPQYILIYCTKKNRNKIVLKKEKPTMFGVFGELDLDENLRK